LDARPSEVEKGSVAESPLRRATISSSPVGSAAAVSPVATAVLSIAGAAAAVAREERDEMVRSYRFARVAGMRSTGLD
jgi:hypothetical protein